MNSMLPSAPVAANSRIAPAPLRAWLLGGLGVALFAFSLPATRLAVGSPAAPELAPLFVALARAALAGLLAAAWLLWRRQAGRRAGCGRPSPRWRQGWCSAFPCSPAWHCDRLTPCMPH
jgi:hypothetical protein